MNNTDWKILIYLREERSINKVAKRLFMTQPSLTYRLSQMEKEIGCPLFIRTNKGVHFTDAGNRLFSFAEKELQQYQDMRNYVTHEPNSISGVLRIGASQSFAQSHMPAILKGFVDQYSDIEISLTTDTSDELVKLVKKEDIHLAIVRGNQEWPDADILLEDAPLYLISAKKIDYSTLPDQPSIRYRSDPSLDELRTRWWRQNFTESPPFHAYRIRLSDLRGNREPGAGTLSHSCGPSAEMCAPGESGNGVRQAEAAPSSSKPPHLQAAYAGIYAGENLR